MCLSIMSPFSHRFIRTQSSLPADNNMRPSNVYSIKLPYLGEISLGKSPSNLNSFQKPLFNLYTTYYLECFHNQRRIMISDSDLLILESDSTANFKNKFIHCKFDSIVDVQLLKLSFLSNHNDGQSDKVTRAAFLPIGCENQERFHSNYSSINKSYYNLLSPSNDHHPLLLFILRKPNVGHLCSLLDCHVFSITRESSAFEICNRMRKLIIKRTMSPLLTKKSIVLHVEKPNNETNNKTMENRVRFFERNRPMSSMEFQNNNHKLNNQQFVPNVILTNVTHSTVNTLHNPLSSSSLLLINNVQHAPPSHDTSKVLAMKNNNIRRMSSPCATASKQRHFIKASSVINDECDEVVNDLMNIVAREKLKTQVSVKRHASFDHLSCSDDNLMSKKRYFHNKKRFINTSAMSQTDLHEQKLNTAVDAHLARPKIVLNRYGDIGSYVPKFLRENTQMRSSDSNENIFFRATNGQILNGFLKIDILSTKSISEDDKNNNYHHYQSTPCLNEEQNVYSLVQQLKRNHANSIGNLAQNDSTISNRLFNIEINQHDDDHRVPHMVKSLGDIRNGVKIQSFTPITQNQQCQYKSGLPLSKPKRINSFTIVDNELPIDYRQYLRPTDQGAYLYGQEKRQQQQQQQQKQITLEHSLGYYP